MRYLIILLLGAALGAAGYWYFTEGRSDVRVRDAERRAGESVEALGQAIKQKVSEIDVNAIRDELSRTGRVIRRKAQRATEAFKDDGADARNTAALRAKIAADPNIGAREITVAVRSGQATLSGAVSSHEEIARAMQVAFEVEGVREVISELQVRRAK